MNSSSGALSTIKLGGTRGGGGQDSILASRPSWEKMRKNYFNFALVNQWRWIEESGQWLENVDQTHLVLASGKLVLQKKESHKKPF